MRRMDLEHEIHHVDLATKRSLYVSLRKDMNLLLLEHNIESVEFEETM